MTDEPKTRRRLSDDEKTARLTSQLEMIAARKREKNIERVKEAHGLLEPLADDGHIHEALRNIEDWLTTNK